MIGILNLFLAASMPVLKVLLITAVGSFLALDRIKILTEDALKHLNTVLFSKAGVIGLGPKFMSIYIQKLAIERHIYYDEVEGLTAEWLDATCTLVLNLSTSKRLNKKGKSSLLQAT
ncbi:uncharacterized protein LOC108220875 [Daucus carota subsp. sativus]|uniref:uncharacterized protein LOC108220875 n=1 Tax=Daucus carota subsp. sativus TaxID=79200 RepID=UPI0007EFBFCB|nr:PREDICTED: uncharacterized protein LOC108220875 [Daucus carota subsp. sativus]XP_017250245.1 PREDICTED: uncharacterized protein LOC108220875 [Daucus carota subsp. sativus]